MRELTPGELNSWYTLHRMPCGHGPDYILGPRGAAARNIICPTCQLKINVLDPQLYGHMNFRPGEGLGQLISAPAGYVPPPDPPADATEAED